MHIFLQMQYLLTFLGVQWTENISKCLMVNERNSLLSPHEVTVTGSYLSLLAENQKGYKVEYHVQDLRFSWKITDMFVDSCSAIMGTSREELVY